MNIWIAIFVCSSPLTYIPLYITSQVLCCAYVHDFSCTVERSWLGTLQPRWCRLIASINNYGEYLKFIINIVGVYSKSNCIKLLRFTANLSIIYYTSQDDRHYAASGYLLQILHSPKNGLKKCDVLHAACRLLKTLLHYNLWDTKKKYIVYQLGIFSTLLFTKTNFRAVDCIPVWCLVSHRCQIQLSVLLYLASYQTTSLLKMGSYSSTAMCQYGDNHLIYWEYTDMSQ